MCVSKTTWKDDIKKINKKKILTFQTRDPSYYTESTIHEKKNHETQYLGNETLKDNSKKMDKKSKKITIKRMTVKIVRKNKSKGNNKILILE
jgi:hypothetical protein